VAQKPHNTISGLLLLFQMRLEFRNGFFELVVANLNEWDVDASLKLKVQDLELYHKTIIFKMKEELTIPVAQFKEDIKKRVQDWRLVVDFVVQVSTWFFYFTSFS
jgi:hypothetical protein